MINGKSFFNTILCSLLRGFEFFGKRLVILEIGVGATFIIDEKDKYCLRGFIKVETKFSKCKL